MGKVCAIEYVDSSVNEQMGCDGCELWNPKAGVEACYAGTQTNRYAGQKGYPLAFDQPQIFPGRLAAAMKWPDLTGTLRPDKPHLNGLPRIIFLDDMGDTYTESLPLGWLRPQYDAMERSPHIYLFLTKRPGRMKQDFEEYGHVPDNFILGTTYTSAASTARLRVLADIPARYKWISYEPMWGPPTRPGKDPVTVDFLSLIRQRAFQWIVAGGESGDQSKPFHISWPYDVQEACYRGSVPFFWKQNGEFIPIPTNKYPEAEWRTRKDIGVVTWLGNYYGAAFGRDETVIVDEDLSLYPHGATAPHLVQRVGKKAGGQHFPTLGDELYYHRQMPFSAAQFIRPAVRQGMF